MPIHRRSVFRGRIVVMATTLGQRNVGDEALITEHSTQNAGAWTRNIERRPIAMEHHTRITLRNKNRQNESA